MAAKLLTNLKYLKEVSTFLLILVLSLSFFLLLLLIAVANVRVYVRPHQINYATRSHTNYSDPTKQIGR